MSEENTIGDKISAARQNLEQVVSGTPEKRVGNMDALMKTLEAILAAIEDLERRTRQ